MDLFEKTLNEKEIFNGKIIRVHLDDVELPDKTKSFREVVEHSGGVCVAPVDENYNLTFVRQFRYPFKKVLWELPAGKLEKGENPLEAGLRELHEECGVECEKIIDLGTIYPTVAYCSEIIYLFAATGLKYTSQKLDEGEFLEIEKLSLEKATEMVLNGEISDAKTVAIILKLNHLKQEGKI